MTGLPTGRVYLDDGNYATDVSSRVELNQGIEVSSYGPRS